MSAITSSSFYSLSANGWRNYSIDKLENKAICAVVIKQCTAEARMEKLKAFAWTVLHVGLTIGLAYLACAVTKVSFFVLGVVLLPFAIIFPPLYWVAVLPCSLVAGWTVLSKGFKAIWMENNRIQNHFHYGNHLYQQAASARLRQAQLSK